MPVFYTQEAKERRKNFGAIRLAGFPNKAYRYGAIFPELLNINKFLVLRDGKINKGGSLSD